MSKLHEVGHDECNERGAQNGNAVRIALQLVREPAAIFKTHAEMRHDATSISYIGVGTGVGKIIPGRRMRRKGGFDDGISLFLRLLHSGSCEFN